MLQVHPWIFPIREWFGHNDLNYIPYNSQLLYRDLLARLVKGKTWFGLHYNWPTFLFTNGMPDDCDTIVISWHLENWDHEWLHSICNKYADRQIIIISEFDAVLPYPNVKVLRYHCWDLVTQSMINEFEQDYQPKKKRPWLASSLVLKPSFFKCLITAHLCKHHRGNKNLVLSWNASDRYCESISRLQLPLGNEKLEKLRQFYLDHLVKRHIPLDAVHKYHPWQHWNFTNVGYQDAWVNFTNETYSPSLVSGQTMPGPYISEKTWKPLLAGTAMIPIGMPGTYKHLEKFGFQFEYPWSKEFDNVVGDLDRMALVLDQVDWLLQSDMSDIVDATQDSCNYNYHHIRSKNFVNCVQQLNNESVESFFANY